MDAKFPMTNYMKFVEAESEQDAQEHSRAFIRDDRDRTREVVSRDYINSEDNPLDYVLVFIPNEPMFHYILQNGATVVEEALRNKVVLRSPISLFAILSVIRHAIDNFAIARASDEMLTELALFNGQWDRFVKQMGLVGKRFELAQSGFESLAGTRRRALKWPLVRIQAIRKQRGLPKALEDGADSEPEETGDAPALPEPSPIDKYTST